MASANVAPGSAAELGAILDSPEIRQLVDEFDEIRWTGRPGYSIRAMVGIALFKSMHAIPVWTKARARVHDHPAVRAVLGCESDADVPSLWACYRFAKKLRTFKPLLDACLDRVLRELRREKRVMGFDLAMDGTDLPAYSVGQKTVTKNGPERERFSDPDARSGHRSSTSTRTGGWFFSYKLHMAVCTDTELPLAWTVESGEKLEHRFAVQLLDAVRARGFSPETCTADSAYDTGATYENFEARGCRPIIPLRQTGSVKKGLDKPPRCRHGEWEFKGVDYKRKAAKYRCPKVACTPGSVWIKADRLHTLIPRDSERWWKYYKKRTSVERAFGWLKTEGGLLPLRVRRLERVQLHVDLTMLSKLAASLTRARLASA